MEIEKLIKSLEILDAKGITDFKITFSEKNIIRVLRKDGDIRAIQELLGFQFIKEYNSRDGFIHKDIALGFRLSEKGSVLTFQPSKEGTDWFNCELDSSGHRRYNWDETCLFRNFDTVSVNFPGEMAEGLFKPYQTLATAVSEDLRS